MFLPKGSLISGDVRHNYNPNKEATGVLNEEDFNKNIWNLIIKKLGELGYKTDDYTPKNMEFYSSGESLKYIVRRANESQSSLHLSICFNDELLEGVRCLVGIFKWNAEKIANQICKEISNLGLKNNGVRNAEIYILQYTKMPCILIEFASIKTKENMKFYDEEEISAAIVKAITGKVY